MRQLHKLEIPNRIQQLLSDGEKYKTNVCAPSAGLAAAAKCYSQSFIGIR